MSTFVLPITSQFAVLNIAILIVLAFAVVHQRVSNRVLLGDGGVAALERAIRAHGNLAEYMPSALILLALLEFNATPAWQLYLLGGLFSVARLSHIHGIVVTRQLTRAFGALTSIIAIISMIGLLLTKVLGI